MADNIFIKFCNYVDENIFPKENLGETVAFIIDRKFIDDFCKKEGISEQQLFNAVKQKLHKSAYYDALQVKGILAIQIYAATKREDSGGITEKNYRDRLSQILDREKNRTSRVECEQHFLYLSEEGHIDIRDKNMRLEKQLDWHDVSLNGISRFLHI